VLYWLHGGKAFCFAWTWLFCSLCSWFHRKCQCQNVLPAWRSRCGESTIQFYSEILKFRCFQFYLTKSRLRCPGPVHHVLHVGFCFSLCSVVLLYITCITNRQAEMKTCARVMLGIILSWMICFLYVLNVTVLYLFSTVLAVGEINIIRAFCRYKSCISSRCSGFVNFLLRFLATTNFFVQWKYRTVLRCCIRDAGSELFSFPGSAAIIYQAHNLMNAKFNCNFTQSG